MDIKDQLITEINIDIGGGSYKIIFGGSSGELERVVVFSKKDLLKLLGKALSDGKLSKNAEKKI